MITLTASKVVTVEAVGQWFEAYQQKLHGRQSFHSLSVTSSSSESEEEDDVECEDDKALLLGLDPKEWKASFISFNFMDTILWSVCLQYKTVKKFYGKTLL